ncbi:hypothetical protein [Bradyrhizobium liaoningense]|uniref:hypothetical protein n=1 Tax=Bradyrhizobium liaoningense TaxID=43992 RepID=UPI001BAB501B|nr:hypothetical protein [Bradyrhizobium liaoningense]MBR0819905.1 hypothetical protein [Bradyrhizobium liaoningense]
MYFGMTKAGGPAAFVQDEPGSSRGPTKDDADSHSLMRKAPRAVRLARLKKKGAVMAMDRVEQAFVATAITGFVVMLAAIVWMMIS